MENYKATNPEEAAALEVEIAALVEEAKKNHNADPWCRKLFERYPSRQEWKDNPARAGFIDNLFEAAGFSVRYGKGGVPGWIVKE